MSPSAVRELTLFQVQMFFEGTSDKKRRPPPDQREIDPEDLERYEHNVALARREMDELRKKFTGANSIRELDG